MLHSVAMNSDDHNVLDREEVAPLRKALLDQVNEYLHNYLDADSKHEFYITTSWMNQYNKNDYSGLHYHSNSLISGVLYFDDCTDTADALALLALYNFTLKLGLVVTVTLFAIGSFAYGWTVCAWTTLAFAVAYLSQHSDESSPASEAKLPFLPSRPFDSSAAHRVCEPYCCHTIAGQGCPATQSEPAHL